MNTNRILTLTALAALTTGATATAQFSQYLLTYSQTE
ncbi:MAG: hypothetical protein ACI8UD_000970, partial [Planctomycetota bacterium]